LKGREGFGFLSPSHQACEAGFSTFEKMKRIFSIAPVESFREVVRVFLPNAGVGSIRCWPKRPVCCQSLARLLSAYRTLASNTGETLFARLVEVDVSK